MTEEQPTREQWYEEGNRRLQRGELEAAKEQYLQALTSDPDYADAHNKLGVVFAEQGDKQTARQQFERALALDDHHASALTNLGNLFFLDRDWAQAEHYHRLAIQYDPDNSVPHNNLAAVLKKQRKITEFVDEIKKAQRLVRAEDNDRMRVEARVGPGQGRAGCLGSIMLVIVMATTFALL